ncbi:run domain Beclin-1-interacting and cysteine-rich domain-containing protein [Cloeon dipterum]|uniref:run domain Beclin-1-interacting and cysteine-rich domain-containing protein n=1 Tax=Cloeon dipterum TaxID=197152 RepID=UPI00321FAD59
MSADEHEESCRQLLQALKCTAEGLLAGHSTNVWSVYGGLQRLHSAVLKILQHGLKTRDPQGFPDPWAFVEALQWLQPSLATSPPFRQPLLKIPQATPDEDTPSESRRNDQYSEWLFKSLESHTLSTKLSWLLSDRSHLETCFEPHAFFLQSRHAEAALICLRAVEQGQPSLLNDLDPRLYLSELSTKQFVRSHRRCSSFPDNVRPFIRLNRRSTTLPHLKLLTVTKLTLERQWNSEPSLSSVPKPKTRFRSSTVSSANLTTKFDAEVALRKLKLGCLNEKHKTSSPDKVDSKTEPLKRPTNLTLSTIIQEDTPKSVEKVSGVSLLVEPCSEALSQEIPISPASNSNNTLSKLVTPVSSLSISPQLMSTAFLSTAYGSMDRKTSEITSFLDGTGKFSDPAEELCRENAHFSVSEAMIAAIERAKYERSERKANRILKNESATDDTLNSDEEDDVEIARLQEKIRARRREMEQKEKRIARSRRNIRLRQKQQPLTSDGRTDTPNTDQSSITPSSSPSSDSDKEDSQDHLIESDQPGVPGDNLARVGVSGLSMSLASLYSESELASRQPPTCNLDESIHSHKGTAEGVAFALLSRFKGKVIPNESELQWLVSENDVPQKLLPLPTSWPVNPDEAEDEDMTRATQLRGNLQWAPPRAQIIFHPHPSPNRKILLAKQNYMCAGCGMKVEQQYANKMRFCEYLGRYFCTGCHGNQLALIPGRIIFKWDFSRRPVSSFSYRLLDQMQNDALFQPEDLNASLFAKSRQLAKCKMVRIQLAELNRFISNCRFAKDDHNKLAREPSHLTQNPEVYSMVDLLQVKTGELVARLQQLVNSCQQHVVDCKLCIARGFYCEICRKDEILFPWEVSKVLRCRHCGCCLHLTCWHQSNSPPPNAASPQDCPRCRRLKAREQQK